ncbi:hypothetical protein E2R56_04265 [Rhodococcus qingshengii]|nr:hypothetical protein E2R56_04265 [Rhodococcus qingshengii]
MNNNSRERRTIVVRATPEMANWMHPQTDERKLQIQKRVEAAKARYSQRTKNAKKSANPFSEETELVPNRFLKYK